MCCVSFFLSRFSSTGDGHEQQPLTDKKENDLSGYERNLYLYHVSSAISFILFPACVLCRKRRMVGWVRARN